MVPMILSIVSDMVPSTQNKLTSLVKECAVSGDVNKLYEDYLTKEVYKKVNTWYPRQDTYTRRQYRTDVFAHADTDYNAGDVPDATTQQSAILDWATPLRDASTGTVTRELTSKLESVFTEKTFQEHANKIITTMSKRLHHTNAIQDVLSRATYAKLMGEDAELCLKRVQESPIDDVRNAASVQDNLPTIQLVLQVSAAVGAVFWVVATAYQRRAAIRKSWLRQYCRFLAPDAKSLLLDGETVGGPGEHNVNEAIKEMRIKLHGMRTAASEITLGRQLDTQADRLDDHVKEWMENEPRSTLRDDDVLEQRKQLVDGAAGIIDQLYRIRNNIFADQGPRVPDRRSPRSGGGGGGGGGGLPARTRPNTSPARTRAASGVDEIVDAFLASKLHTPW